MKQQNTKELKNTAHYITMYPTAEPKNYIKEQTQLALDKGYNLTNYKALAKAKYNKAQEYTPISWAQAYSKTQYQLAINDTIIILITDYYNDNTKRIIQTAMSNGTATRLYIPKYQLEYNIKPIINKATAKIYKANKIQIPWSYYNRILNPIQEEINTHNLIEWAQTETQEHHETARQRAIALAKTIHPEFPGDTKEEKMAHIKQELNNNQRLWDIDIPSTETISIEITEQYTDRKTNKTIYLDKPRNKVRTQMEHTDYDYTTAYTIAQYYIQHNLVEPNIKDLQEEQEYLTLLLFNPDNKQLILDNLAHYAQLYERLEELNFRLAETVSYEKLVYKLESKQAKKEMEELLNNL